MAKIESHKKFIIEQLQDPEFRKGFLKGAIQRYKQDNNLDTLMLSYRYSMEARALTGEPLTSHQKAFFELVNKKMI